MKTGDVPLPTAHLIGFTHAYLPTNELQKQSTLLIDLTKSNEQLFSDLKRTNRNQIRQASKYDFQIEVLDQPSSADIQEFQNFYNEFAKYTNTYKCGAFHVKTMEILKESNNLVITKIVNKNEVLCYQVYITDEEIAFSFYAASHFRLKDKAMDKRMLSIASRYLIWQNILYFKERNKLAYDVGGLTTNENISSFKREFGGEITEVYSGYEASSILGKLVLFGRTMKMRKG